MITVIDYGLGNIAAFLNIYKKLNIEAHTASSREDLLSAERLILPGVGAFDWAMRRLNGSGLRKALDEIVIDRKKPVLGICVGMQIMARSSEEGTSKGLGWIDAEVKKFDVSGSNQRLPLPHMGWNDVRPRARAGLFCDFNHSERFYFLHSYYFRPFDPDQTLAETDYNGPFTSAIGANNIFGVQFHPEKSHDAGIRLLKNFAEA